VVRFTLAIIGVVACRAAARADMRVRWDSRHSILLTDVDESMERGHQRSTHWELTEGTHGFVQVSLISAGGTTLARKKTMTVSSSKSTLPLSTPTAYLKSIQRRSSKKQSIDYVVIPCMIATNRVPTRGFGLTFTWIGTPLSIDMQRNPWWRPSGLTRIGWPLDVTPSSTK
jgi:hypothetical protein